MATVGVLALQGAARAHRRMLEQLGVSVREVRRPAHLDDVEALVIPGGESTTISLLLDRSGLRHPLVERLSGGMAEKKKKNLKKIKKILRANSQNMA